MGAADDEDYSFVSGRATAVIADPGDDRPTLAVGAIALQPTASGTSNVVLVGTGEADFSEDSYYGLGILRSTDAGATWNLITQAGGNYTYSFPGQVFSKIAFSTDNPNLVVAAAALAGNSAGLNSLTTGLYYSTDAGQTWTGVDSIALNYAATSVICDSVSHRLFAALQFDGYYTSSDGIQWSRLANQPGPALMNCQYQSLNGLPFCGRRSNRSAMDYGPAMCGLVTCKASSTPGIDCPIR